VQRAICHAPVELCAFIRIGTNPRVFERSLTLNQVFGRGVFGGISSELKSKTTKILDVFSSIVNPSLGAKLQKIPIEADRIPRLIGTNSNRRHRQDGSTTGPQAQLIAL
jgi:hypothetical protein